MNRSTVVFHAFVRRLLLEGVLALLAFMFGVALLLALRFFGIAGFLCGALFIRFAAEFIVEETPVGEILSFVGFYIRYGLWPEDAHIKIPRSARDFQF